MKKGSEFTMKKTVPFFVPIIFSLLVYSLVQSGDPKRDTECSDKYEEYSEYYLKNQKRRSSIERNLDNIDILQCATKDVEEMDKYATGKIDETFFKTRNK